MSGVTLADFVENAALPMALFDAGTRLLAASPSWREVTRRPAEAPAPEWLTAALHRALAGESLQGEAAQVLSAGGLWRTMRLSAQPWRGPAGEAAGVCVTLEDAPPRNGGRDAIALPEAALRRVEQDFGRAQELGRIGWWRYDIETCGIAWSEQTYRMFGVPVGTPLDYGMFLNAVHPDDRDAVDMCWQAALAGDPYDIEHRIVVDGATKWMRERAYLDRDEQGRAAGAFGVVQDITDLKLAEQALRDNENEARRQHEELEWIYQNAPIGLAFLDKDMRYKRINRWLAATAAVPVEAHIGRTIAEVMPMIAEASARTFERLLTTRRPVRYEDLKLYVPAAPDVPRHFNQTWYPAFDPQTGEFVGAGVVVEEITESKRAEALSEIDRRKNEFLATLAHELRNPLASIRYAIDLVNMRSADDPATREKNRAALARAENKVEHLEALVDELLQATRITQGKIELKKEPCLLGPIVTEALELVAPQIDAAQQIVSLDCDNAPIVDGDPLRLVQIFANLIENASKYSERGGAIRVTAGREGDEAVVRVRDHGVGIARKDLPWIFQVFAQIRHETGRARGGIGIGLALVRSLVVLHGGRVEAHSDGPGCGSEFIVRLPLRRAGS